MISVERINLAINRLTTFKRRDLRYEEERQILELAKWALSNGIPSIKTAVGFEPFNSVEPRPLSEALAALPEEFRGE